MALTATITESVRPQRVIGEVATLIDGNPFLKMNFGKVKVENAMTSFRIPSPAKKVHSVKFTPLNAYAVTAAPGVVTNSSDEITITEVTSSNVNLTDYPGLTVGMFYITVACTNPGNAAGAIMLYEVIGE